MRIRLTIDTADKGKTGKVQTAWFEVEENLSPEELEKRLIEKLEEIKAQ